MMLTYWSAFLIYIQQYNKPLYHKMHKDHIFIFSKNQTFHLSQFQSNAQKNTFTRFSNIHTNMQKMLYYVQ